MMTTVRCFARIRSYEEFGKRRGIWLMTSEERGVFYHGDREEIQAPRHNLSFLASWAAVVEITPQEVLGELRDWPAAQDHARGVFDRHPKDVNGGSTST